MQNLYLKMAEHHSPHSISALLLFSVAQFVQWVHSTLFTHRKYTIPTSTALQKLHCNSTVHTDHPSDFCFIQGLSTCKYHLSSCPWCSHTSPLQAHSTHGTASTCDLSWTMLGFLLARFSPTREEVAILWSVGWCFFGVCCCFPFMTMIHLWLWGFSYYKINSKEVLQK